MITAIEHKLSLRQLSFSISKRIIFTTMLSAIFIICHINNNFISPINASYKTNLRQLNSMTSQIVDQEVQQFQFKWAILRQLISQTYFGTWETTSNNTNAQFLNNKGSIQIVFNFLKRTNIQGTYFFDYNIVLFDGEDNKQSAIISNSYFFTLAKNKPKINYDDDNNLMSINDQLQSFVSQYKYLTPTDDGTFDINATMIYHSNQTGINLDKQLNGTIAFKGIDIVFHSKQIIPSFYQSVSSFCCWLVVLGMIQVFYFNYQLKLFNDYPDEAFKYSSYTFVVNCLYNGSIGFECFLAAMINERLFYIFIIPSIVYFVNFSFTELKVILLTMNIHERYNSRNNSVLRSIRSRLVHFCILFCKYIELLTHLDFLLICLFIYSFDVFFWKSVNFLIVIMTFVPQIIYGVKKKQNASIVYIILVSLNKIYIPIYFRAKGNFLYFKNDNTFIASICIVIAAEIVIILFQRVLWKIHYIRSNQDQERKKKKNRNKLCKTIEELTKKNIDISNMKCCICLGELNAAYQLKANSNNTSLIANEEVKNSNSTEANNKSNEDKQLVEIKQSCCKKAFRCFRVKGHKDEPIMVMMTPCKHIFHIECLEEWMKIKYSCPQCRCILPQIN